MLSFITILYHTSLSERLFPSIKWTSRFCKLYNQHSLSLFQFTICRQSPEKKIDANAVKFDNACVVGFFHLFSVRLYSAMASSYFRDSRSTALPLPSIAVPMPL